MDSTCPIKLLHAQSRRRARLDVPLRMAQLRAQIAESFPELGAATVEYVDEEGDVVVVMSDAELEEAQRVYADLGRVLSFVVRPAAEEKGGDTETRENTKVLHAKLAHAKAHSTAKAAHTEAAAETEASPLPGTPFGPGSFGPGVVRLQHALIKLGHMRASAIRWRAGFYGPRTTDAVAKVARDLGSKDKAELAGVFTQSIRAELLDQLRALESGELVLHHGITCDGSGEQPLRGVRYHKINENYDLNAVEFAKLSPAQQHVYEVIKRPGSTPVPIDAEAGTDANVATAATQKEAQARDTADAASPLPVNIPLTPGSFGPGVVRLQHALIKLGHMRASAIRWRAGLYGPRTTDAVAKVARDLGSKDKAELAGVFTQSIRAELLDQLHALESGELVLHHGIWCDASKQFPLRGVRYHKIGCDYDLNGTEFAKLSPAEQRAYEAIERPGAMPMPVDADSTLEAAGEKDFDAAHNTSSKCPEAFCTSEPAATASTVTGVQTLLDMGFNLPAEALNGVLLSVNGNVGAAVAKLLG